MAAATQSPRTELAYVGARPYIRGADVYRTFEQFARGFDDADSFPARVRAFKVHREIECDGCWRLDAPAAGASATLDFVDRAARSRLAAFVEDGRRIIARSPDLAPRATSIEAQGEFAGRARIAASAAGADLLDALIEVNKALHAATLRQRGVPTESIRFIYVEELPWLDGGIPAQELVFRHLGARTNAGRVYTLNAVSRNGAAALVRICYSFVP